MHLHNLGPAITWRGYVAVVLFRLRIDDIGFVALPRVGHLCLGYVVVLLWIFALSSEMRCARGYIKRYMFCSKTGSRTKFLHGVWEW